MNSQSLNLPTVAGDWTTFGVASIFFNFWHKPADLCRWTDNFRSSETRYALQPANLCRWTDNFRGEIINLPTYAGERTTYGVAGNLINNLKIWGESSLLRKLFNHLQPLAGWDFDCTPGKVCMFNPSYFCGTTCQGLQVYGQSLNLPMVSGVLKWLPKFWI